ncbi:hypothetical protein HUJ04_007017 [Dendroctonus ponderosae]|nr:hypothetical protein HUJ04_007017 [Dendroctonus ponderosae]
MFPKPELDNNDELDNNLKYNGKPGYRTSRDRVDPSRDSDPKPELMFWVLSVDKLANIGTGLNVPLRIELDRSEIISKIRNQIRDEYCKTWQNSLKTKGIWYSGIVSSFPKTRWFDNLEFVDRNHITTIIRIRTGHCLSASHLFRIKIRADPSCECGSEQTLDHIFLECPINYGPSIDIYKEMILSGLRAPLNIAMSKGSTVVYFVAFVFVLCCECSQ